MHVLRRRRSQRPPVGAVLAGGEGRRLGGDKATVELLGRPLALLAVDVLVTGGLDEIAVVAKAATALPALPAGVRRWNEPPEPRHPLAGVAHALRRADGRPVVVVPCDLPLVPAAVVGLLAERAGRDGALARTVAGQPLLTRFEPGALAVLARVGEGARVTEVVERDLRAEVLDWPYDEDLLNVNTPADVLTATDVLARRRRAH